MKRSRRTLVLKCLLIGHLLCNPYWFYDQLTRSYYDAAFLGILISQFALLGFWLSLAKESLAVKLGVVTLFLMRSSPPVQLGVWMQVSTEDYTVLLFLQIEILLGMWLVAQWTKRGWRLVTQPNQARNEAKFSSLQFSLRDLMMLIACASVTLGVTRYLDLQFGQTFDGGSALASLCFLVVAAPTLWACLGPRNPIGPVAIVLCGAIGIGCGLGLFGADPDMFWFWLHMLNMQAAVICATLLVVRACGYRLVKREVATETSA